jgi:hypothetical protein
MRVCVWDGGFGRSILVELLKQLTDFHETGCELYASRDLPQFPVFWYHGNNLYIIIAMCMKFVCKSPFTNIVMMGDTEVLSNIFNVYRTFI